jgi:hypothetical protein
MPAGDPFDRLCGIIEQPSGSSPDHGRAVLRLSLHLLLGALLICIGRGAQNASHLVGGFDVQVQARFAHQGVLRGR